MEFYELCKNKKINDEIFSIQLQGTDPLNIDYYRNHLERMQSHIKKRKASMTQDEIKTYKTLFDGALKKHGRK